MFGRLAAFLAGSAVTYTYTHTQKQDYVAASDKAKEDFQTNILGTDVGLTLQGTQRIRVGDTAYSLNHKALTSSSEMIRHLINVEEVSTGATFKYSDKKITMRNLPEDSTVEVKTSGSSKEIKVLEKAKPETAPWNYLGYARAGNTIFQTTVPAEVQLDTPEGIKVTRRP